VNEEPDSMWAGIFETIRLRLSFFETTVECSFENWGVIASHVFVDVQRLLTLVFACKQTDNVLRIPDINQHDNSGAEEDKMQILTNVAAVSSSSQLGDQVAYYLMPSFEQDWCSDQPLSGDVFWDQMISSKVAIGQPLRMLVSYI
jgi:hypothetical protein